MKKETLAAIDSAVPLQSRNRKEPAFLSGCTDTVLRNAGNRAGRLINNFLIQYVG
jgi:hypothetical protein